jgi:hypothetical protein
MRVYQPNPQTHNPSSQIYSITTGTCTKARWHLEEKTPPIVAKRALSQRLYTPSVEDTHINKIRRCGSRSTGLRARSNLNQRDLADAFRHIPAHPDDWWLLRFHWMGIWWCDQFLPFGCHTLAAIFDLFASALEWILQT